jgi:translocation protein SEC63
LTVQDVQDDEDDEEDISDPEEDTLAGQMAMMRGGKVKPSPVHGGGDGGDGEDEESGSESEYESSSDEDGPRGKKIAPLKRNVGGRVRAINEDSSDSD